MNQYDPAMTHILLPEGEVPYAVDGHIRVAYAFGEAAGAPGRISFPASQNQPLVRPPKIGETVEGGWKYGGVSVTTKTPLFVAPKDQPLVERWRSALEQTAALVNFMGHSGSAQKTETELLFALKRESHDHGVRLPTADELSKNLYPHHDDIGGFDLTGRVPFGWYRSSTSSGSGPYTRVQKFKDGTTAWHNIAAMASIRLVRS